MTGAPKDFLAEPRRFGQHDASWVPAPSHLPLEVALAWLQHRTSIEVRSRISATALEQGLSAPRGTIAAKLSGNDWIQLRDLLQWRFVLDDGLHQILASSDLFPHAYLPWLGEWTIGCGPPTFSDPGDGRAITARGISRVADMLRAADSGGSLSGVTKEVIRYWLYGNLIQEGIRSSSIFSEQIVGEIKVDLLWGTRRSNAAVVVLSHDKEPPSKDETQVLAANLIVRTLEVLETNMDVAIVLAYIGPRIAATVEEHVDGLATGSTGAIRVQPEALASIIMSGSARSMETYVDLEILHLLPPRRIGGAIFLAWQIRKL